MASTPTFGILGPLEITTGGSPVALGSRRQRQLLLRLLVAEGPVPVDELVEAVWADRSPPSAATSLRSHVSRLRDVVGRDVVVHRSGGYALVADAEVDADAFERDVECGRTARAEGDLHAARQHLRRGLRRWRGDALPEVRYEPYAQPVITQLEALRAIACEEALAVELELDRAAEVVPELEAMVVRHPLREEGYRLLMTALHRSGRTAEALAAYRRARQCFVAELGMEPSPVLQQLHAELLRLDAASEPRRDVWARVTSSLTLPDVEAAARCDLLLAAGRGHREAGELEAARRAFAAAVRAATAIEDGDRLARAVLGLVGPPEDSLSVVALDAPLVERALLGVDGDAGLRLRARLAVGLVDRGDPRGRWMLDATVAAARSAVDPVTLAYTLRARQRSWFAPEDLTARLAASDELVSLGEELADPDVVAWGRRWRSIGNLEAADLEAVQQDLDALAAALEERPNGFHGWFVATRRAGMALLRSPGPAADAAVLHALALTDQVRSEYTTVIGTLLLWAAHLLGGRRGELLEVATELEETLEVPVGMVALAHAELGDLAQARTQYRQVVAAGVREVLAADTIGVGHLLALTVMAELAARLGDRRTGAVLYELLDPYAGRLAVVHPGVTAIATTDHVLGELAALLGDTTAAQAHRAAGDRLVARTGAVGLGRRPR